MTIAELGPVLPLAIYAMAVFFGSDPHALLVPMLIAEIFGIIIYMVELRDRFKYRNGRRR